ncbi:MAG: NADH-quinone oxidoreductase subunit L [Actinomycetia bacterium]|nr:NADH-quinone oxidoreductase subunit L [Actinomycetes bacterium]
MIASAWIALFAPAVGVALIALARDAISRQQAGIIAAGSTFVSFTASLSTFAIMLGDDPEERSHFSTLYTWLSAGSLEIGLQILVDPLAVFMMLVVSGVGFLILTYAIGYMHGDDEGRRYHAYKALFVFSMLLLVQAGNLLILLVGWGMVGLSSYLLINYWHQRSSAVAAGKKAFIVNAFGDAAFVISIFLLAQQLGALDFLTVFGTALGSIKLSSTVAVVIALGLLGGAVAKSAQVPLHTWLPDAMEGPTPVSALIHAATMVTAGVYLIVRTHVLFELAPAVLDTAALLGGVTILIAGAVALVQTDIKRVIAYSTMSQIGYMFAAVGLGAFAAGMFHLMTHAFFKALLFMAAGTVIHALANEQDIRKMRGLARELPWTYRAFLIGTLALAAIPPFAGFFSKDVILAHALAEGLIGPILWAIGLVGALLTALYAFRLLFIVFTAEPSQIARRHLHRERFEGPLSMMLPIGALVALTAVAGFIQVPGGWHAVDTWLEPVAASLQKPSAWMEIASPVAALALAALGTVLAWRFWGRESDVPAKARSAYPRAAGTLEQKFYFDEAYDAVLARPTQRLAVFLKRSIEEPLILSSLGEIAGSVRELGQRFSRLQTGLLRSYALALAAGLALIAAVFIAVR